MCRHTQAPHHPSPLRKPLPLTLWWGWHALIRLGLSVRLNWGVEPHMSQVRSRGSSPRENKCKNAKKEKEKAPLLMSHLAHSLQLGQSLYVSHSPWAFQGTQNIPKFTPKLSQWIVLEMFTRFDSETVGLPRLLFQHQGAKGQTAQLGGRAHSCISKRRLCQTFLNPAFL